MKTQTHFVDSRKHLALVELLAQLDQLLDCCEVNMDQSDPATRRLIKRVADAINNVITANNFNNNNNNNNKQEVTND